MTDYEEEFLTKEELIKLTGWKRKERQKQWLSANGLMYYVDRNGYPVVSRECVRARGASARKTVNPLSEPRFEFVV